MRASVLDEDRRMGAFMVNFQDLVTPKGMEFTDYRKTKSTRYSGDLVVQLGFNRLTMLLNASGTVILLVNLLHKLGQHCKMGKRLGTATLSHGRVVHF